MSATKGIDISQYQRNVDFRKVKAAGYDFVIIRAGFGKYAKQKDPQFETHYRNAKAAGLNVGAYWYSYAASVEDAKAEAKICLEVIKGKQFEYPIYFDLEERAQFVKGRSFCDGLVKTFCGELEKAGYFAGLYISRSPLQQYISADVAKRYALWIAEYGSKCNYKGTYGMWQYSSTGRVSGVNGNCDLDYSYKDYPAIMKEKGLNGYAKAEKVLDSSGFKRGDKSDGVLALKQLLMLSGFKLDNNGIFGEGTQKAVNALLKKWGYSQNGIAGTNFIKKLSESIK